MTYADPMPDETALFDQVRRFTVHDGIHGGYVPAVIGWWDYLDCTRCLDHPPLPGDTQAVIDCGNSAAEGDRCDWPGCGVSILAAALDRSDQGGLFPSTCAADPGRMLPLAP